VVLVICDYCRSKIEKSIIELKSMAEQTGMFIKLKIIIRAEAFQA
jgi:hypothetical protein